MTQVIRFPLERTRVPQRTEFAAPTGSFADLMTEAKYMGGWIHWCKSREFSRFIIKAGHSCAVCGDKP